IDERYTFPIETVTYETAQPKIVASYHFNRANGISSVSQSTKLRPYAWVDGLTSVDPSWGTQTIIEAGIGEGCDFFNSYSAGSMRVEKTDQLHEIEVTRSAKAYVIWRSSNATTVPDWLKDTSTYTL